MIEHHFLPGLYAKETRLPAGTIATQHVHPYDHVSVLTRGSVLVTAEDVSHKHDAPAHLLIRKGVQHSVAALTDAVWYCIHATDETDPANIDEVLLCHGSTLPQT